MVKEKRKGGREEMSECIILETDDLCKHCNMPIRLRNPSGFCDHLHYPDYCKVCKKRILDKIEEQHHSPVVSLKALKVWIEEHKLSMVDKVLDVSKLEDLLEACSPNNSFKEVVSASDLLAWAEKEAGK